MNPTEKRIPLYSQIREYVLVHIQQRRWRANDRLPTEKELAARFNVSKFTVKKALSELVDEGIVYRIQGRGSFVAETPFDRRTPPSAAPVPSELPDLKSVVFVAPNLRGSLSSNILAGAEEALSAQGFQLIVKTSGNEREQEERMLEESVKAGARGVLIFPADGEAYNEDILRLTLNHFPVVVIDRYLRGVETNCVCSDNEGGASDAVTHLAGLGHRHIAFAAINSGPTTSLDERLDGYKRSLARHGLPPGPVLFRYNDDAAEGGMRFTVDPNDPIPGMTAIMRSFLLQNPGITALFAATPMCGLAVLEAASELGLQVPGELSVVFFDDIGYSSFFRTPPTCIAQPEIELGAEAAKLLLDVIRNPFRDRRKLTLPTRLIVRESTAPPSPADPRR